MKKKIARIAAMLFIRIISWEVVKWSESRKLMKGLKCESGNLIRRKSLNRIGKCRLRETIWSCWIGRCGNKQGLRKTRRKYKLILVYFRDNFRVTKPFCVKTTWFRKTVIGSSVRYCFISFQFPNCACLGKNNSLTLPESQHTYPLCHI